MSGVGLGSSLISEFAQQAIENRKDSRSIVDASTAQAVGAVQLEQNLKQKASNEVQFQQTIQTAQAAVSVVTTTKSEVKKADAALKEHSTTTELTETAERVNEGSADMSELLETKVTEENTLGDLFGGDRVEEKVGAIIDGNVSEAELKGVGFSDKQVKQLTKLADKDGSLSLDDAVDFIYENRLTPKQAEAQNAENRNQKVQGFVAKQVASLLTEGSKAHEERARKGIKTATEDRTRAREGRKAFFEVNKSEMDELRSIAQRHVQSKNQQG